MVPYLDGQSSVLHVTNPGEQIDLGGQTGKVVHSRVACSVRDESDQNRIHRRITRKEKLERDGRHRIRQTSLHDAIRFAEQGFKRDDRILQRFLTALKPADKNCKGGRIIFQSRPVRKSRCRPLVFSLTRVHLNSKCCFTSSKESFIAERTLSAACLILVSCSRSTTPAKHLAAICIESAETCCAAFPFSAARRQIEFRSRHEDEIEDSINPRPPPTHLF